MRTSRFQLAVAAVVLALVSGCASSNPLASRTTISGGVEKRPKLMRTQVGAEVTLQWQSEPGKVYGVVYSNDIRDYRSWRVLPGYDRIVGNGGMQQVTFTAPVQGQAYYRLRESAPNPTIGR